MYIYIEYTSICIYIYIYPHAQHTHAHTHLHTHIRRTHRIDRATWQDGLPAGSLVTVRLDLDAHTLSFALNAGPFKTVIENLPTETYYPSFGIFGNNRSLTVVAQK
jgi:hypothetical protein